MRAPEPKCDPAAAPATPEEQAVLDIAMTVLDGYRGIRMTPALRRAAARKIAAEVAKQLH